MFYSFLFYSIAKKRMGVKKIKNTTCKVNVTQEVEGGVYISFIVVVTAPNITQPLGITPRDSPYLWWSQKTTHLSKFWISYSSTLLRRWHAFSAVSFNSSFPFVVYLWEKNSPLFCWSVRDPNCTVSSTLSSLAEKRYRHVNRRNKCWKIIGNLIEGEM